MKKNINLFTSGLILIILAVSDAFMLAASIFSDELNVLMNEAGELKNLVEILFWVIFSVSALVLIVQILLGVKGIMESKNPTSSKWHIRLAKVFAVVKFISAVLVIIGLFNSTELWSDILSAAVCIANGAIMIMYAKEAQAIRIK